MVKHLASRSKRENKFRKHFVHVSEKLISSSPTLPRFGLEYSQRVKLIALKIDNKANGG